MDTSTIVVLGGPAAGKTVFLSALYHHLWNGFDGFQMRAATGTMHSELLSAAQQLESGVLPPATHALKHLEFQLDHYKREYRLRCLDFPGELFHKVFYECSVDTPEARELYDLSTSADAVIALVDPACVGDCTIDIDYALTNLLEFYKAARRIQPKLVLAFTKRDKTQPLVGDNIGAFVRSKLPRLAKAIDPPMLLQHFCSIVQTNGATHIAQPAAVTAPLRCVVNAIESERMNCERDELLRRSAWKELAVRTVLWVLCVASVVVAFVFGVIVRG